MLLHYAKLAQRHLTRNWKYLAINTLGLGVAIAFCMLSYLNFKFTDTFNQQHQKGERIFRITTSKVTSQETFAVCQATLATQLGQISEVEATCRYDSRFSVTKHKDLVFNDVITFADSNFFQMFDFEVLKGRADLTDRQNVVFSKEMAVKYFGQEDPIGKTVEFYADTDYKRLLTVVGVLKTAPMNSSFRFSFITHLDNQIDAGKPVNYGDWKYFVDAFFVQLKTPEQAPTVLAALQQYVPQARDAKPDWQLRDFGMAQFAQLGQRPREFRWDGLWQGLPSSAVWGNLTMALLLLVTAILNFVNMTIAVCNRRLRELSVRTALGSTRGQQVRQLLGESFAVVFMATLVGCILLYPICDWFNSTWKFTDLRPDFTNPRLLGFLAATLVGITLLAGSYPALYLTAFKPSSIFRGNVQLNGSGLFTKIMMGLQVAISMVCVVVGLSFARNARMNHEADIGFDHKSVLQAWVPKPGDFTRFRDAVSDIPGVTATTGTVHLPGFGYTTTDCNWEGTPYNCLLYKVGNDFGQFLNMKLVEGHWPLPAGDTTASSEVLVNTTFVREITGNKPVVGQSITFDKKNYVIAGVVHDFMTNNPFSPIESSILSAVPSSRYQRCLIKTARTEDQPKIMAAIETKWKSLFPYAPFNVGYQSEIVREASEVSANIAESMGVFALIALLLSVTGLFSLISLEVLRRLREVCIRRVMGASAGHVAWVLNRQYLLIFGVATIIGCVGGRMFAILLMDSIFKINHGVSSAALVAGASAVLLVAFATIGAKLRETLRTNPAEVLRS